VNPKTTGILFLIAAALAAFVYFYELGGESDRQAAEEAEKRLFPGLEPEDVSAIELTASDGVALRAERRGGGWRLVEPLDFAGAAGSFDAMASALVQTTGETAIDDSQAAAVYGLDADERVVRFTAGDAEHALRVGDKTPVGANSYVSVVGADRVYIVPTYRVNAYARAFDDLREKRILDLDPDAVNRLEASWPEGRVVLSRGDEGWALVEPIEGPADQAMVEELLGTLGSLRAIGFMDLPLSDSDTGLDRPAFAARVSGSIPGEAGGAFEAQIAIGSVPDGNSRLVRGQSDSLYRIHADRLEDLPTRVVDYRFKQLAEFEPFAAERISILFHTAGGESIAITAERGETGWTAEPEAFAPGKLTALLEALADLRARDIAAESLGEDELRAVELEPANAVFRVLGKASEDEAAPELASVNLGLLRGSEGILAQRTGEEIVYLVDYELAEHLPVSYEAFANRFRAEAMPGELAPEPELDSAP
jgi:hypothetical protein